MAHDTKRMLRCMKPGIVEVDLQFTIGAAGAVSSFAGSIGVDSVVKASTGVYTVTLDRGYADFLLCLGTVTRAAGALLTPIDDAGYTAGSTTFTMRTAVTAGTATEPSSGDKVRCILRFDELDIT